MGICGTGMGSFAGMLKTAGFEVRGSDINVYPPMSDKLQAWGIPVLNGYRPENLSPKPDLVIVGNVIRRDNPEAQAVVAQQLPYTSFPKALGELFLTNKHSVVVSGTHGKTTTTSLIAWLLTHAGLDPGMLVGGVPGNFNEGFRLGKGPHFVVEGDEYDTAYFDKVPKFLHYQPNTAIMTSLEFDHADIYDSVESIEAQFDQLVALIPKDGQIIACKSAPRVMARLQNFPKERLQTYSARPGIDASWIADNVSVDEAGTTFQVLHQGTPYGTFRYPLPGLHNIENALAAICFCAGAGLDRGVIASGLQSFEGVARRQTIRAEVEGVRIIDDFAHHPTAVRETVRAVRARYDRGRLFAIFEPRTATSSRKFFQEAYASAFEQADEIIIAGVGRKELAESERLDVRTLAEQIAKTGRSARSIEAVDDIVETLARESRAGDTLLLMSNGGFGGIYEKLEKRLRARGEQD